MLWGELENPVDRFRAAASAGFSAVERVWVYDLDVRATKVQLDDLGLQLVLFDPYPGDWMAGERGLLCIPGREADLLSSVRDAVDDAQVLGTRLTNVLAGVLPTDADRMDAHDTARRNLDLLLDSIDFGDVTVLLESVCGQMWPGSYLDTVDVAAHLVREVDDPRVRLQFDAWHVAKAGLDPHAALERHHDITAHVQVADNPGRHQPGTGQLGVDRLLARLDELDYTGYVGLEYVPKGSTEESLAWLPVDVRS
jgi:hydroxypyruvate isomerase